MGFKHDYTGVQESGDFTPAPPGDYTLKIVEAEEAKTRNGDPMVKVKLQIADGQFKGKNVWHNVAFLPKDSPGAGISKHWLKVIGQPHDGPVIVRPGAWIGARLGAGLNVEEYESAKGPRKKNTIVDIWPLTEATARTPEPMAAATSKGDDVPF